MLCCIADDMKNFGIFVLLRRGDVEGGELGGIKHAMVPGRVHDVSP